MLKKYRTISGIHEYCVMKDPQTAITEYFIRTLVIEDKIPFIKSGGKYMIAIEDFEEYLGK